MKNKLLTFLILTFFSFGLLQAQTPMTKEERDYAVEHLKSSANEMKKALKGLTEEQLKFRPNAESWSIEECVKHIMLSEENIWNGFVEAPMANDPDPSRRSEVKMTDEQITGMMGNRSQKVKTFGPFEPGNRTEDVKSTIDDFKTLRGEHLEWTKNTDEDLRNRYAETPFGVIDSYQAIIFMSSHTSRHVMQMKEIMADANFPSK